MLKAITGFLSALSPLQLAVFLSLAVASVGAIDFATGYEVSVSAFYTIPIGIGAWYAGRRLARSCQRRPYTARLSSRFGRAGRGRIAKSAGWIAHAPWQLQVSRKGCR